MCGTVFPSLFFFTMMISDFHRLTDDSHIDALFEAVCIWTFGTDLSTLRFGRLKSNCIRLLQQRCTSVLLKEIPLKYCVSNK